MTPKINQEAYASVYISLPWSLRVLSIPECPCSLALIEPGEPFRDDDGRR